MPNRTHSRQKPTPKPNPCHGVCEQEVVDALAGRLQYTPVDFTEYVQKWREFRDEQKRVKEERERLTKLEAERIKKEMTLHDRGLKSFKNVKGKVRVLSLIRAE